METMGERIKRLRTARGLTQKQLSEAVGQTWHTACNWELERNIPRTALLHPMARALGVTTDYLLTGREAPALAALHAAIRMRAPYERLVAMVERG